MLTKAFFYVLVLSVFTSWAAVIPVNVRDNDSDFGDIISSSSASIMTSATQTSAAVPVATASLVIDTSKYYALMHDYNQFLSSKGDTVTVSPPAQRHSGTHANYPYSFEGLQSSKDKSVRHRFPNNLPGMVVSESHNDHAIGEDGDKWNTNQSTDKGSLAVAQVSGDGKGITIGIGGHFIGKDGEVSNTSFTWTVKEITGVAL